MSFNIDLYLIFSNVLSAYDVTVPAQGKVLAKTDIQIELPSGCYGRVAPRSGLAHKNFIDVGGWFFFIFADTKKIVKFNCYVSTFIDVGDRWTFFLQIIQACSDFSQ